MLKSTTNKKNPSSRQQGEAPTKDFFRLAKSHNDRNTIDAIIDRGGRESTNDHDTLESLTDFYEDLLLLIQ